MVVDSASLTGGAAAEMATSICLPMEQRAAGGTTRPRRFALLPRNGHHKKNRIVLQVGPKVDTGLQTEITKNGGCRPPQQCPEESAHTPNPPER